MKRLSSSDSLGGLMSICPNSTDEHNQENNSIYTNEFQNMFEGLDEEECGQKKRRLSIDQVKALEKNFEVENKLEPERKIKLAQELGLQPRQVAVWFQNRRARLKTKQLERDYGVLKANYDCLKHSFEKILLENEALLKEIQELKSKLNEDDKHENPIKILPKSDEDGTENFENFHGNKNGGLILQNGSIFSDLKDGSCESDSSAILNEEHNNNNSPIGAAAISSSNGIIHHSPHHFLDINFKISDSKPNGIILGEAHKIYQPQFVKIEEHNFFGEESCTTLFSDDQPPSLHWYSSHEWN